MPQLIVCPACDLVHRGDVAAESAKMHCSRCHLVLHRPHRAQVETAVAVAISSLVFFCLGNFYPLVEFRINGTTRETNLLGAAVGMLHSGHAGLSLLVLATTIAAPLAQILGLLYLLIPLRKRRPARRQRVVFRILMRIRPWTFVEVFMLGAVVALVRLSAYAKVIPGIAMISCGLLMMCLAALTNIASPEQYWYWVSRRHR